MEGRFVICISRHRGFGVKNPLPGQRVPFAELTCTLTVLRPSFAEVRAGLGGGVPAKQPDAEYWLERAYEARRLAAAMTLPEARLEMLKIAAAYERMAEHSEKTAGRSARTKK